MASSVGGGRGRQVVDPLTKPAGREVWRRQNNLDHFEDEKLAIYHRQLNDMGGVFEDARSVRTGLQEEYARRNQLILDLLAEIRAEVDARTAAKNDEVLEFAHKMYKNVSDGKAALNVQLKKDMTVGEERKNAANEEIYMLNAAIRKEVKDCQEHTLAEIGPIKARLAEHRVNLEAQVVERHQQHEDFCQVLKDNFKDIRERLAAETGERVEELKGIKKVVQEDYIGLNLVRDREDTRLREKLQAVRTALQEQKEDRTQAQTHIVEEMVSYMNQFEEAIAAMNKAQADTSQKLQTMKKKTGFT